MEAKNTKADNKTLRLEGVYDLSTVNLLKNNGVNCFSWDFRPRSFTFLQLHAFQKLVENTYIHNDKYYLHFTNEKEFIINKILQDFYSWGHIPSPERQFYLEFSDTQTSDYYQQYAIPFCWHYHQHHFDYVQSCSQLQSLAIDYSDLDAIWQQQNYSGIHHSLLQGSLPLIVRVTPEENINPQVLKSFQWDTLSLIINSSLELSYRKMDHQKLLDKVLVLQNFLS